jgi:molybdenum cofactor cytidylyltransferase
MPGAAGTDVVGILLAAGAARRFGSDKLMHPLKEGTPLAAVSGRHLAQALPGSVVVVRSARSALADRLEAAGLVVVECPEAEGGMGHTLAAGVRATPRAGGWVVALADMPYIRPESIQRVAREIAGGAAIAMAAYEGARGHPVGFAARYYPELIALRGDQGARDLVKRDAASLSICETADPGVLRDIDTPADLQREP